MTDADARRLRALPGIAGGVLLPLAAILIPTLVSVAQATTVPFFQGNPYEPWSLLIYDVFTESVPFMLAGLAIGLLSPAAGVLFVAAYGVANVSATMVTGELVPPLPALFGRFASVVLLWLLVVDIPLVGRLAVEWGIVGRATAAGRSFAILGGTFVAAALVLAWSLTAGLLIGVVFWLTSPFGTGPTLRASNTLETAPQLLVIPAAALALLLLALRYLRSNAPLARDEPRDPPPTRARRLLRSVVNVALIVSVLSGVLSQAIDAVILVAGIVLGRPIARAILRRSGLAGPLARIPWPIRLVAGGAAALAFSVAFIGLVGNSEISRWFNAVVAIVLSFVLVEIFIEADDVASERVATAAGARGGGGPTVGPVVTGLLLLQLGVFVFPTVTRADAYGDAADTFWLLTGLAAGSSAIIAGIMMAAAQRAGREFDSSVERTRARIAREEWELAHGLRGYKKPFGGEYEPRPHPELYPYEPPPPDAPATPPSEPEYHDEG